MKRRGIPVVYYVAPQFWAWRQGRVRLLRDYVDKALVIFPKSISALTNLAWLRATSSNEALRNGNEAVTLAGQADEHR